MNNDNKGPYIGFESNTNDIGFSISVAYHRDVKDFQISILILDFAIAAGWLF